MANTQYQEFPLTFEKGLVAEIEESVLDTGQAASLVNWEPATYGGLRVRNAYTSITTTGLTAPYKVRGFGSIATGTAVAGAITGPQIFQSEVWPNGDADPVTTKTITLNGVNIGNVLVAIVADNSNETPVVTAGWTERAVSTGNRQHVKFYTKTATASTEAFTYTITQARIRSVTVHEMRYLSSEDPGSLWAAQTFNSGSGGSDTVTVNATDTDGGFALVGYHFDGGTPHTSDSGTSGYDNAVQDNANTRIGVSFQDLDQLDGSITGSGTYVSPSWTPPASGIVIILIWGSDSSSTGTNIGSLSVTGNNLTWHDCYDAGELGEIDPGSEFGAYQYAWADCSLTTPTAGSITVTVGTGPQGVGCSFVLAVGADTTDPFVQSASLGDAVAGTSNNVTISFGAALQSGSGVLGAAHSAPSDSFPNEESTWDVDANNMEGTLDVIQVTNTAIGPNGFDRMRTYYTSSAWNPDASFTWDNTVQATQTSAAMWEIRGSGNSARTYHGSLTGAGTAIEGFSYVANKEMTAKMVVWGYTPPSVSPDSVDFYIVMALAEGSTTYKIYRIGRDNITSGTWEQIDAVTNALNNDAFVSFAQGAGNLIWTASTMNYPRAIELATLSQSNITDMLGLAGRTAAYHKDRMFMAGSSQNPSRLYFSGIGTPTDFTTATDFLDIGGDDGEAIQDLSSVEGLLLVPKTNRAYLISGSGVESFFVNELSGGTAAAGRSAIRTPYGTVLAGNDDVWVVQGGGVDPMSRPLGGGYVMTGNVSTAYAQDMALIADAVDGRVWRVNLVTGAWSEETTPGDEGVYITYSLNGRLYYGTNGSTTQVGGTRRLTSDRTYDQTTGEMDLHAETGRMAMVGPHVRYTPRHLYLQLRNQDPTKPNELFVTVETNLGSKSFSYRVTEATQREYRSVGWAKGVEWIKFTFDADGSAQHGSIDVERAVLTASTEDY